MVGSVLSFSGLGLLLLSLWQLSILQNTYRFDDIWYSQSPVTLQAWMRQQQISDLPAPDRIERLADRLLVTPLAQRRILLLSMARPQFWTELTPHPVVRTTMRDETVLALEKAVSKAPLAGDLWYLAAKLKSDQGGFDAQAARYIELSQIYAPKATEIALARVYLLSLNWNRLGAAARVDMNRDVEVVLAANPRQADKLREDLIRLGIDLEALK